MSSSSDAFIISTPPEVSEAAKNATLSLLPEKSNDRYLQAYQNFITWKTSKYANSFSENVFLAYFMELSQKYKSSSLWCYYSMLKSTVRTKHGIDIKSYSNLQAFLKRRSEGHVSRKSKVFSADNVKNFLKEAPDCKYLATKVFRTHNEVDYECAVTISAEPLTLLMVVIRYPIPMMVNCVWNKSAFTLIRNNFNECMEVCTLVDERSVLSHYFEEVTTHMFNFRFANNSTINNHIKAHFYQVTVTTARRVALHQACYRRNETTCIINDMKLCFTSGVYCDGIKNCGISNWYDERNSECGLFEKKLNIKAVLGVVSAMCIIVLAVARLVKYCLPSFAKSFFIFSSNDDNRLRIDPFFKCTSHDYVRVNRMVRPSIIPVDISSSDDESDRMRTVSFENSMKPQVHQKPDSNSASSQETMGKLARVPSTTARQHWGSNMLNVLRDRFKSTGARSMSLSRTASVFNRIATLRDNAHK